MADGIADFFGADLPAIQQEMLRQRQMLHGDPSTNIPAPASPETLQNMQRAVPPQFGPTTPPPKAGVTTPPAGYISTQETIVRVGRGEARASAYLSGVLNGVYAANAYAEHRAGKKLFCPPPSSVPPPVQILKDAVTKDSFKAGLLPEVVLSLELLRLYPCR